MVLDGPCQYFARLLRNSCMFWYVLIASLSYFAVLHSWNKIFSRLWDGWSSAEAWWGAELKQCAKLLNLLKFANFCLLFLDPYRLSRKIRSFWRFRVLGVCFPVWNSFSAPWNSLSAPWNYFSAHWNSFSAHWNSLSAPWNYFSAPWNSFFARWNFFFARWNSISTHWISVSSVEARFRLLKRDFDCWSAILNVGIGARNIAK